MKILFSLLFLCFVFNILANNSGISSLSREILTDTATVTHTDASCYGASDASITITATGVNTPFQFSIDSGLTYSSNSVFTALTAGVYYVFVKDNSDNIVIHTAETVHQPQPVVAIWTISPVSCHGFSDADIVVNVPTYNAPHTFLWSNNSTDTSLYNVPAGAYSVTITDNMNCSVTHSMTIDNPDTLVITSTHTNITCSYDRGSADISVTGGEFPYSTTWPDGTHSQDAENLTAGPQTVTVTDHNNCHVQHTVTITQPSSFLTVSETINPVSCHGQNDGSIVISLSGGNSPYSILWSNDSTNLTNTQLAAGTYTVTVSDQNACSDTVQYLVTQPGILTVTGSVVTNPLCYQGNNGAVNITVSGGTPNYSYAWNFDGTALANTEDIENLPAGTYIVQVTDLHSCTTADTFVLSQPEAISVTINTTNVTCQDGADGQITASVSGGTGIYTEYRWINSLSQIVGVSPSVTGLSAGNYQFSVTDSHNCTFSNSYLVTEPAIQTNFFVTNLTCNGAGNGAIDLLVSNDASAHTFIWSNNATTEDLSGIEAGTYHVTVTYNSTCNISDSVTVTQPVAGTLTIQSSAGFLLCDITNVQLTAQGGFTSYLWSTGGNTQQITVSDTGAYSVIARDANQCIFVDTVQLSLKLAPDSQSVCMVTVDTLLQKNLVIWNPVINSSISSYNIYKETSTAGIYSLAGSVLQANAGYFKDDSSTPATNSDRYKISVVDTCGNESVLSAPHRTTHLEIAPAWPSGFGLGWFSTYEGFEFSTYYILRSLNNGPFAVIDSLSSMNLTYTDLSVPANTLKVCYRVDVIKPVPACSHGSDIYSRSTSNNACYEFPNSVTKNAANGNITIYPNPFAGTTTIEIPDSESASVAFTIKDITGKTIRHITGIKVKTFTISAAGIPAGMYFIEISGDKIYNQKIIIK